TSSAKHAVISPCWRTVQSGKRRRDVPSRSVPVKLCFAATVQSVGRPARQAAHSRHDGTQQSTTSSPGRRCVTPSPTSTTTPAPSWPRTIGQRPSPSEPSARWTSEWHTPAAATRTSTSPGPGGSSSTSSTRTSPGRCSTAARIVDAAPVAMPHVYTFGRRGPACRLSRVSGVAAEIAFDRATKRYPGRAEPAVRELTLTVPAGEICCLVGPSGAGKTTAMKMVNRLIDISEGDIRIGGTSVRSLDVTRLRRGIGYVIQQVGLFPHMSVADNVATVPRLLGWSKEQTTQRVDELLDLVELPAVDYRAR